MMAKKKNLLIKTPPEKLLLKDFSARQSAAIENAPFKICSISGELF